MVQNQKKDFTVLNLLWISFLIFCFIIILSIAILICSDKRLLLLQVLHILNNKQNTSFILKKFFSCSLLFVCFYYDCIFKSLFCIFIFISSEQNPILFSQSDDKTFYHFPLIKTTIYTSFKNIIVLSYYHFFKVICLLNKFCFSLCDCLSF